MKHILKIIYWIFLLFAFTNSFSQTTIGRFDRLYVKTPGTAEGTERPVVWDPIKWEFRVAPLDTSGTLEIIPGGEITMIPSVGFNPGTDLTPTEWIINTFYGFVHATISLITSNLTLYQVGTINNITLNFSITPKSEISFVSGHIDRMLPSPQTEGKSWGGGNNPQSYTIKFTPIKGVADSLQKAFRAFETVGGNGTPEVLQSQTVTISSCYPYLYGMSTDGSLTNGGTAFYDAMTKRVQSCSSSTSVDYDSPQPTLQYAYFAFPANCTTHLTSILDQNQFEQLTNFSKTINNVSSIGLSNNWTDESYVIYRSNTPFFTTGDYWRFTFKQ